MPRVIRLRSSSSSTSRFICCICRSIIATAARPRSLSVSSRASIQVALTTGASGLRSSWASIATNSSLRVSTSRSRASARRAWPIARFIACTTTQSTTGTTAKNTIATTSGRVNPAQETGTPTKK